MKIGNIGTGAIAAIITKSLDKLETIHVKGVYSRTIEKAETFAEKYRIPFYTSSLDALCQQSEIDVIYVATPHSSHKEHVRIALKHNKHVLCEKPFTLNEKDAQELFGLAKEKNLFLGEAFWTRFNPVFQSLKEIKDKQVIGEFKSIIANIGGYGLNSSRLTDKSLAGGALLDIGVYNLNLMFEIFGSNFTEMTTVWNQGPTGVDYQHTLCFAFDNQATARLLVVVKGT
jgi:predicted dehydrogenase